MASADPFWKDAVEGIAKNVHESAERFRDSVGSGSSLAAFTSKGVEQLQAAVDELVEMVNAKVKVLQLSPPPADGDPVQAADEHVDVRQVHVHVDVPDPIVDVEHVDVSQVVVDVPTGAVDGVQAAQEPAEVPPDVLVPEVVRDVVTAANVVLEGVKTEVPPYVLQKLRSAMDTLLVGVGLSVAAPELTHDRVYISRAPGEVEVAAQSFRDALFRIPSPSVESNEAFRHLVQVLRGATNRVLFGVEVLGATQELVGAAREFKELAIEDPRVVDSESQGVAMEKIRDAATLVPDPVPRSICAVNEVALAAKRFQDWASEDKKMSRSTVHVEVTKFQKTLQEASKCVDDDRNEYAYAEAVNLSLIKLSCVSRKGVTGPQYPLHKAALEDWEQKEKELFSKVSRRQGMRADLTNQIFNIIGWYAVFLGVVLSAVSQLTQTPEETTPSGRIYYPLCSKIWFPVSMTGFGLVATIFGIWYKFRILMSLELTITTEKQAQREIERRINTLRRKGPDSFSFTTDVKNNLPDDKPKGFGWGFYLLVGLLIVLAVLFSLSYGAILCNLWVTPKNSNLAGGDN